MKALFRFKAIIMAIVLLLSSMSVRAQSPISGFYYPADEMVNNWEYYADRSFYYDNNHLGADIDLVEGVAVKAIATGKIVNYSGAGGYGELVVAIEHELPEDITFVNADGGLQTTRYILSIYGHLRKSEERNGVDLTWSYGDIVQQGDIIGYVNNSSHPDGVFPDPNGDGLEHLHLGIRLSDELTARGQDGGTWLRGYNNGSGMQIHFANAIPWISGLAQFAQSPSWRTDGSSQAFVDKYGEMSNQGHNLGDPWDNGGSAYVHELNGMLIQDFQGANNNFDLPYTAITYFHNDPWYSDRIPRLLKEGFWWEYMTHRGWVTLGIPVTDEYPYGNNTRQRFWRLGPNYANNAGDWEERYLEWNPSLETIVPLDQNAQPMSWAEATVLSGGGGWMSSLEDFRVITEPSGHGDLNKELGSDFGGGGAISERVFDRIFNHGVQTSDESGTLSDRTANGVYHSGVQIADFNQPFELIDQQNYSGFYAMVNDAAIPIDNFTMNGDMTIYIDSPPPAADLQFDFWTIYPNPGIVGGELHVEGEMWNAGGTAITVTEVRVELLDPNGSEVYHYSMYDMTIDPGWSWYQWLYCYPYMPGNHTARFRCLVAGQWQTLAIETIYVQPIAPVASFGFSPVSGTAPLTVQFTDWSTNTPTSWYWTFGDGQTSTLQNPSHVYSSAGTYTVSLTATNVAGSSTHTWDNCVVVNLPVPPPVAAFSRTPSSGTAPLTVHFTDQSTGNPTAWLWDFGDGVHSTAHNPSRIYSSPGTYNVSLTATNATGSDTTVWNNCVTVSPAAYPPVADFTADVTSGSVPLTVQFTDQSINNPTLWSWNFGDGQTSVARNPSHIYSSVGTYTVTLVVNNSYGMDDLVQPNYIHVGVVQLSITYVNREIILIWNNVPGVISYRVYGANNGGDYSLVATTANPHYTITGSMLNPGNTWLFYVTVIQ